MLMQYIQAALRHASYEILSDDGSFYGDIPSCSRYAPRLKPGVKPQRPLTVGRRRWHASVDESWRGWRSRRSRWQVRVGEGLQMHPTLKALGMDQLSLGEQPSLWKRSGKALLPRPRHSTSLSPISRKNKRHFAPRHPAPRALPEPATPRPQRWRRPRNGRFWKAGEGTQPSDPFRCVNTCRIVWARAPGATGLSRKASIPRIAACSASIRGL